MYRTQLKILEDWISRPRRKPIILRGARQVGKSTLVRLFANQHGRALAAINLERYPDLAPEFAAKNPSRLLNVLEALPDVGRIRSDCLLFLDEIQAVPEAIPMLRYFYEDMTDLPVLAAGSLMEFVLADHRFSMPVGRVEYLHMGPMTFSEFLLALDETTLVDVVHQFQIGDEISPLVHKRLIELLRTYFFVGGMPEAVETYSRTRRLKDVSKIHNAIIDTYRDDFPKYIGSRDLGRIQRVFNFAARNIGRKVKYSQFSRDDKSATIKADIELLCMARVLSRVVHSHCNGLPLQAEMEEKNYKVIFLDVGLMNAVSGLNWNTISSMADTQLINEGTIAEQFIGQHLQDILADSPNRELTYWLREGRSSNAEVDYVLGLEGRIVPIEIKAGATGSLKSLHQFAGEKGVGTAVRFNSGLPSLESVDTRVRQKNTVTAVRYQLLSLPLYLVERLPALIAQETRPGRTIP